MKRQFLHEHHNRQDKAYKPDYREELRDKPPTYAYSPDPARIRAKQEAREEEIRRMRRRHFILDGYQYKFGWPLEHFAKINGLGAGDDTTKQIYKRTMSAAEQDMKAISAAIMKGNVRKRSVYFRGGFRLSLGLGVEWEVSGLRCDEIK